MTPDRQERRDGLIEDGYDPEFLDSLSDEGEPPIMGSWEDAHRLHSRRGETHPDCPFCKPDPDRQERLVIRASRDYSTDRLAQRLTLVEGHMEPGEEIEVVRVRPTQPNLALDSAPGPIHVGDRVRFVLYGQVRNGLVVKTPDDDDPRWWVQMESPHLDGHGATYAVDQAPGPILNSGRGK